MAGITGTQKALGAVFGLVILIAVGVTGYAFFPSASNQGYAPEQPIPFSHKVHAGDNKIACQYCHANPEKSRHSTVPPMSVCLNCHTVVKLDSPWVQKLREAYKNGQPIEWVRVHELPDFVYFTHKRHVTAGLACETCHGNVKAMDKIEQVSPLTMGWCMDCHRGVTTPKAILERIEKDPNRDPMLPKGHAAATNCTTCHN